MGGGGDLPDGWLLCNGASLNNADYPELAKALGASGSTFTLPDYRNRVPQGAGNTAVGTAISAGVPNVTGIFCRAREVNLSGGAEHLLWTEYSEMLSNEDYSTTGKQTITSSNEYTCASMQYRLDISRASSYYNGSTVQPPALTAYFIIKS